MEFATTCSADGTGDAARRRSCSSSERIVIVPVINVDGYIASRDDATDPHDTTGDPADARATGRGASAPPGGNARLPPQELRRRDARPAMPVRAAVRASTPTATTAICWGGPGASHDPNSQSYRGTGPWSEPETQAVHEYSQTHDGHTLITMHNFASLVLRPPGLHDGGQAPDEDALKELGDAMADDTGYTSQYGYQLYDTAGHDRGLELRGRGPRRARPAGAARATRSCAS